MGERCIQHERLDSLLQIFDVMMRNYLRPREGFFLSEDNGSPSVDVELPLISKHDGLRKLWEEGLQLELSQVAESLLNQVIRRLEDRYITLCTWQQVDYKWDSDSRRRSAIEPHEQDRYPRSIDVLIDAARDCLEWLVLNEVDAARQWCNRLVRSEAPLLRRLAIHGLSKREDLTADNKIDWLLTHIDLHESSVHHEVFRAVRLAYPEAGLERRRALISAIWAFRWPHEVVPNRMEDTVRQHFRWFDWLHKSDLSCALARGALDEVLAEYPNFKPTKYPDLTRWIGADCLAPQRSWTPEELLSTPASNQLSNLLPSQSAEWEEPNRRGLMDNVADAATQNFDWGLDLAEALARIEEWEVDLWSALIHAWSRIELEEDQYRKVLCWFSKVELYPKHNREIAKVLYTLVRPDGPSYASDLLPEANEIAAALWHDLDRTEPIEESGDWFRSASSHPAWELANFWLSGFSLWLKHQDPRPMVLSGEYRAALLDIVGDRSLTGKLGRTILTSDFAFLLAVDAAWTREYLLPLFDPDSDDFQAAWSGFLTGGRLIPVVAEVMTDPFLKAVEEIGSDLFNQRYRFIKYYVHMLVYFVEDPIDKWIPKLFRHGASQETKTYFAEEIGNHLQNMAEVERQELWQRWLKRYWKNRLQGIPADALDSSEIVQMLNWLPHLALVFPKAVDLAVQMPQRSLESCWVLEELSMSDESGLGQRHPESVAKLLIYLWECGLPRHSWRSARDLIGQLLLSDISAEYVRQLENIQVQL